MSGGAVTIGFANGVTAIVVECRADGGGDWLVAALGLPPPRGTLVLNGTAAELEPGVAQGLSAVVGGDGGLAAIADAERLTVVTGGTDAGIFALLGAALTSRSAPLVGVAPRQRVTWPGGPPPDGRRVALEPHHSHFVLVDGDEWGDETPALLALAGALGRRAPSVAVVCGGGPVTQHEVLGHVRHGRPVVVVAGSGRFADDLATAVDLDPVALGPGTAEMVRSGRLTVCPVSAGPSALVGAVLGALWPAGAAGRFDGGGSG